MVNYINGKVYKIEPTVEMIDEGDIYIGASAKEYLSQRMDTHRQKYKQWKKGNKTSKIYSYDLFDKYGLENCKITLLEACSCNSRDELKARESHYVRTLKCVNKYIPGRTAAEWFAENKEHSANYNKNYAIVNKERMYLNVKRNLVECECGKVCQEHGLSKHRRSDQHLAYEALEEEWFAADTIRQENLMLNLSS